MSMEHWNPFRDIDAMRRAMDRWIDDSFISNYTGSSGQMASVAVDLHETDNGYELAASLPGVRPDDIDVTVNRDSVVLRGSVEQNTEQQQGNYIYRERHSGTFQRVVRLPQPVNTEQVQAILENGVLKLTLPRLQEAASRRVQVQGATSTQADNQIRGSSSNQSASTPSNTGQIMQGGIGQSSHSGAGQSVNASTSQNTSGLSAAATSTNTQNQKQGEMTSGAGTQRPSVLDNLGSTQMDSLEIHIRNNDEQGFMRLAQSYGWDQQTCQQVWSFMSHRSNANEVRKAFENQSGQSQSQTS